MLQNKFERPLDLALRPSRIFYFYLVVIFICACIGIIISDVFSVTNRLILFILLFVSFAVWLKNNLALNVINLKITEDSVWKLVTKNNKQYEVELFGECIVTYFLIWLNFSSVNMQGKKKKFYVLLFLDSADKEQLRQLRVRLRLLKNKRLANDDAF